MIPFPGNDGVDTGSDIADTQEVSYYEVALGTDRRFPNTRDNVKPFTNVGKNKTITFTNLELVQGTAKYFFSVKAYSASYSMALATSNGFYVSGVAGVTGRYHSIALTVFCYHSQLMSAALSSHYALRSNLIRVHSVYSKTCFKRSLKKRNKNLF